MVHCVQYAGYFDVAREVVVRGRPVLGHTDVP